MADGVRLHAQGHNGVCVLWVSGVLDLGSANGFAQRVNTAVRRIDGPVVADLSGLTFIDAPGARAMAAVIGALQASRMAVVRSCPPQVRLVLETLGLSLNYLPADYLTAGYRAATHSETRDLVDRVRHARLHAGEARLGASWMLAQLADTGIRLASVVERAGLIRERGRRTLATSKAVREDVARFRQEAAPEPSRSD